MGIRDINKRAQQQPQKQISHEQQQKYMQIKNEYTALFKSVISLEEDKKEHLLVYDTIKDLDAGRKCWRMVGGVMVERTIGKIMPPLKQKIDTEISEKLKSYNERLTTKEKQMVELEKELGIVTKKEGQQPQENLIEEKKGGVGVLA